MAGTFHRVEPSAHRVALVEEGARIASLPADELAADVPTCPGWDIEALLGHLGGVHRWATSQLVAGVDGVRGRERPAPPAGASILDWYRESLDGLVAEIDRHDPSEPTRSFIGECDVAFWMRRQAHETAMHRWDADHGIDAAGARPIEARLAVDGIDEWMTLFVPRFLLTKGDGVPPDLVGATLHLHCTDDVDPGTGEWLLRLTADDVEVERAHAKGDAAIRGAASDLALAVWHRPPRVDLDVVGDADKAARILDAVHVG